MMKIPWRNRGEFIDGVSFAVARRMPGERRTVRVLEGIATMRPSHKSMALAILRGSKVAGDVATTWA